MLRLLLILGLIINIYCTNAYAKRALITAATGSFGKEISFHLASEGWDLVLGGRNTEKLNNLRKEILKGYHDINISVIVFDFSQIESIRSSFKNTIIDQLDSIVLIGPRPSITHNDIPSSEDWTKLFTETFIAPLEIIKMVRTNLNDKSSIVVISGSSSKEYLRGYPNSNITRVAWNAEIKNLIHFFGERKIRVNSVSPGPILTEHHRNRIIKKAEKNKVSFDEQMKDEVKLIPLKTYGSLKDVANLVYFLITEKSNHINGSNILLDGGTSNVY